MLPTGNHFPYINNLWPPSPHPTHMDVVQTELTVPPNVSLVPIFESFMAKLDQITAQSNFQSLTFDEVLEIKNLFARQEDAGDFLTFLEMGGFSSDGVRAGREALQFAYDES